jgi:hypothetical protein
MYVLRAAARLQLQRALPAQYATYLTVILRGDRQTCSPSTTYDIDHGQKILEIFLPGTESFGK